MSRRVGLGCFLDAVLPTALLVAILGGCATGRPPSPAPRPATAPEATPAPAASPEALREEIIAHRAEAARHLRLAYQQVDLDLERDFTYRALHDMEQARQKLLHLWAGAAPADRPAIDEEIAMVEGWMDEVRRELPIDPRPR